MVEIARYIKALLQENDCVIVPGLGGFVAHYEPSHKVEEENLFIPPSRTVGFNPQLRMNDGILAQSFMAAQGLNFANATHRIEQQVKELRYMLHEEGKVELTGVGVLYYSIHETYRFVPCDHAITTPSLYGLGNFRMMETGMDSQPYPVQTPMEISISDRHKHRLGIRINREMASNVLMLLVVVLGGFLLSVPVQNTEIEEENYARLMPEELFTRIEKVSLAINPIVTSRPAESIREEKVESTPTVPTVKTEKHATAYVEKKEETRTSQEMSKINVPKEAKAEAETKPVKSKYHIIVASVGTVNDAEMMAGHLKEEGYIDAQALIGNGKKRVSIQSFDTEAEAYRIANKLRKNKAYETAWVLKQ